MANYDADIRRLTEAVAELQNKTTEVQEGRGERIKWMEHFRRFSTMTEINRSVVVQLIQSVHILEKKKIRITFHYQDEFEKALTLISQEREAV